MGSVSYTHLDVYKRQIAQRAAGEMFHGDVSQILGTPDIVDRYDVRMVEPPGGFCLAVEVILKSLNFILRETGTCQCLDRYGTLDERVVCAVDLSLIHI